MHVSYKRESSNQYRMIEYKSKASSSSPIMPSGPLKIQSRVQLPPFGFGAMVS